MTKSSFVIFISIALLGWSSFAGLLSIFLDSNYVIYIRYLLVLLLLFLSGGKQLINGNNIYIVIIWLLFFGFFFYHTHYEHQDVKSLLSLPGFSQFLVQTFEFLLISKLVFENKLNENNLIYSLVIFVFSCTILTIIALLFKYGIAFLFIEATIFSYGVSLISLSYEFVFCVIICIFIFSRKELFSIRKSLVYFIGIVSILFIFLLGKRGALLSIIGPLFLYYVYVNRTKRESIFLILLSIFVVYILFQNFDLVIDFLSLFSQRLAEATSDAYYYGDNNGRDIIWEVAYNQFHNNIYFGYYPRLIDIGYDSFFFGVHPHNYWYESLMTMGLIGSLPFFVYIVFVLLFRLNNIIIEGSIFRFWGMLFVAELIHGTFSSSLVNSHIWICLFIMCHFKSSLSRGLIIK